MNKILFENTAKNDDGICLRIVKEFPNTVEGENFDFILNPVYFGQKPLVFFDGVVVCGSCSVGIVLKLSSYQFYKIHLAIGRGTNIKEELFGL